MAKHKPQSSNVIQKIPGYFYQKNSQLNYLSCNEQFANFVSSEIIKWGKVVKLAGIEPE